MAITDLPQVIHLSNDALADMRELVKENTPDDILTMVEAALAVKSRQFILNYIHPVLFNEIEQQYQVRTVAIRTAAARLDTLLMLKRGAEPGCAVAQLPQFTADLRQKQSLAKRVMRINGERVTMGRANAEQWKAYQLWQEARAEGHYHMVEMAKAVRALLKKSRATCLNNVVGWETKLDLSNLAGCGHCPARPI